MFCSILIYMDLLKGLLPNDINVVPGIILEFERIVGGDWSISKVKHKVNGIVG